jgi:hypothetical protein
MGDPFMKTSFTSTMALLASASLAQVQPNLSLTNDVPITESGIRLIISGGDLSWLNPTALPKLLKVEEPMTWCLHSTSPNSHGLLWLRSSNSFVVNLWTTNGTAVLKTARGRSMGAGPKSPKDVYDRGAISVREGPGRVDVSDFPKLTDLFIFPSNGVYVLEVQCWVWSQTNKSFVLSPPVRVSVLKDNATNQPAKQ